MAITFWIPGPLRSHTGGLSRVKTDGSAGSVREVLERLWAIHPGVRDRVVNERGEVRQHVNVFVGNESIRFTGGLDTPVPDGAEVSIVPAVSGG